jgi:hypothetical protein
VNSIDTNACTLRLTAQTGGTPNGPAISGTSVSSISITGAMVSWTTDVGSTSQVEYGTTTAYGTLTTLNSSMVTSHSVSLTSLITGTLYHYRVRSKNSGGVESISGDSAFQTSAVADTTPPTVSIMAPANGSTVSNSLSVAANASDNVAVTSVQFSLDGASLGSPVLVSPYSVSWNTTSVANGTHTLTAQARDAAGNVGNATGVSVTVSNSTSTALQDFQTRCAQSGVIVCQGFDDPAVFAHLALGDAHSGLKPSSDIPAVYGGSQDTAITASGTGSLKFTVPSFGGSDASGFWRQLFAQSSAAIPADATGFGQNSTFYLQYRQRFSPEYLTNQWPTGSGGLTYFKQNIISWDNETCGNVALVTVNGFNRGHPEMYSQCGADAFEVSIAGGDFLLEQGDTPTTGYNCHYHVAQNGPTSCADYVANTWTTYYYKVQIGTWGQPNSNISAYVSVGGGPYKQFINMPNHTLYAATGNPQATYDMIELLPYFTNRNPSVSAGPVSYTWYDELIVSSQPIAAPSN